MKCAEGAESARKYGENRKQGKITEKNKIQFWKLGRENRTYFSFKKAKKVKKWKPRHMKYRNQYLKFRSNVQKLKNKNYGTPNHIPYSRCNNFNRQRKKNRLHGIEECSSAELNCRNCVIINRSAFGRR